MTAAGVVGAIIAFVAAGCGGPLDTPDPRPRRDAGAGGTGAGGYRAIDAAPEVKRDAPVDIPPDLVRDARVVPDATDTSGDARDGGVDTGWPAVPACVTGAPPMPILTPVTTSVIVTCASSTTALAHLLDPTGQGLVYDATLAPPINGFSLSYGRLCGFAPDSEIDLYVGPMAVLPGNTFKTLLNVTVHGPLPSPTFAMPFSISAVAYDFTVGPADIDFGIVTAGQVITMPVMVTNAMDSAPLPDVYPVVSYQGPLQLITTNALGTPLQPGDTRPLLTAGIVSATPGSYEATFQVSAFPSGLGTSIACGSIRSVTLHAQVIPPPLPP